MSVIIREEDFTCKRVHAHTHHHTLCMLTASEGMSGIAPLFAAVNVMVKVVQSTRN